VTGQPRRGTWNSATLKTARKPAELVNGKRDWYRLTNLADGSAELYIYDEIGFFGLTASALVDQLRDLDTGQLTLRLNSPGGEIFDGIAIYQALKSHRAKVTVQVDSIAASIASVIAMAGDEVVMGPFAQMMIHDGLGMVVGNAADMRDMADLLDRQSDNIAAIYQARAGGQARSWRNRMRAETWYSAQEAVDAGLADKVAKPSKPSKPTKGDEEQPEETLDLAARWDLTVFRFPGRENSPGPYAAQLLNKTRKGAKKDDSDEDEKSEAEPGADDEPASKPDDDPDGEGDDGEGDDGEQDDNEDADADEDEKSKKSKKSKPPPKTKPKPKDALDDWDALVAQLGADPQPDDEFARLTEGLQ
jgi:ATP-dependent protease ClpP protease subunit